MFDTEVDFTSLQKQQILENPEILEDLMFWFSCNLSEGYWSHKNYDFMMGLNSLKVENNEERFKVEEVNQLDLSF